MLQQLSRSPVEQSLECLHKRLEQLWSYIHEMIRFLIVDLSMLVNIVIHIDHGFAQQLRFLERLLDSVSTTLLQVLRRNVFEAIIRPFAKVDQC